MVDTEAETEYVKRIKDSVLAELRPKEDTYTAESFLKHQEMCNSRDCPICSVMNRKIDDLKISNTLDKIESTVDVIADKKFQEKSLGEKRKECIMSCKKKYPSRFTRLGQFIKGT